MASFKKKIFIGFLLIILSTSCLYRPPYSSLLWDDRLITQKNYLKEDTIYLQEYFLCHLIHHRFMRITDTLPWSNPEKDPFPIEIPVNKDSLFNELYIGLKKTGIPIKRIPNKEEGECPVFRYPNLKMKDIGLEAVLNKSFDSTKKVLIPFINIYQDVVAVPGGFGDVNIKRVTNAQVLIFIVQNNEIIYRRSIYYGDGKYTFDPFDPLFYIDRENWKMIAYYAMRPYLKRME